MRNIPLHAEQLIVVFLLSFLLMSCSKSKKEKEVSLDALHAYYPVLAKEIPKDIFDMCREYGSLNAMLDKSYMTPKMHSSIMGAWGPYSTACEMITSLLGTVKGYKLTKVVDADLVYKLVYEVQGSASTSPVTLELFLNKSYGLSEFHLYKTTQKGVGPVLTKD